jgi:methionyl-tRNA formyltransferase
MTASPSASMESMPLARLVYLGNLVSVARALGAVPGASLAACVIEREDDEAEEFREFAVETGCALFTVHGREELGAALRAAGEIDFGVIANFGVILTGEHLGSAKHGFVNAHLGLLPDYPGRHPIQDALRRGEQVTGVTLHRATTEVDRGPVLDRRVVPLPERAAGAEVFDRLSRVAGEMLAAHLRREIAPSRP